MPTVYIVDDEINIRNLVSFALQDAGFDTKEFGDGESFQNALYNKLPDAIVLDWMMPKPDGLTICKNLRNSQRTRHIPIIMLTARAEEADRILGLETGADDYLPKPFSVKELTARVKALIRRNDYILNSDSDIITVGDLVLDYTARKITKNGVLLELSTKEFKLLYELMKKPGRVYTRDILLDKVWKMDFCGDTRTVDVHIRYLRQKIEDEPENPKYIITVRGVGYSFCNGTSK